MTALEDQSEWPWVLGPEEFRVEVTEEWYLDCEAVAAEYAVDMVEAFFIQMNRLYLADDARRLLITAAEEALRDGDGA
jgi:hypothetical protein